ncbi:MAG: TRAP transporter large permease subunit [Pseudomonadota bacterium]
MTNEFVGLAYICSGLLLVAFNIPIGISLGLVSFAGIAHMLSGQAAFSIVVSAPFNLIGNWNFSAVPMFLLMGFVCTDARLTDGLFRFLRIILVKLPGNLAIASVGACALFAAASGSSVATSSAMAKIATPEMLKYKYDKGLATGVIAASGTLGSLIPPSIVMIILGVTANVPIGSLFIAGIIPGIMSAMLYAAMIIIRTMLNPSLAPPSEDSFSFHDFKQSLKEIWPLPMLIVIVIGGIFFGFFSPTAAGSVGAFFSIVIAFLKRSYNLSLLRVSTVKALEGTASIFVIMIGTDLLTRMLAVSGLPDLLTDVIISNNLSTIGFIFAVGVVYLILGMFIDSIGILLLTLPLIVPIMEPMGINMIWAGILLVKMLEIGMITPPVGLNVYVIKGAVGETISLHTIFQGVIWFLVTDVLTLLILVAFPAITLYLPNLAQ